MLGNSHSEYEEAEATGCQGILPRGLWPGYLMLAYHVGQQSIQILAA